MLGGAGGGLSLPLSCLAVRPLAPMMHDAVTAPRPLQGVERFLRGAGYSESALRKIWATDRRLLLLLSTPSVTSSRRFSARLDSAGWRRNSRKNHVTLDTPLSAC